MNKNGSFINNNEHEICIDLTKKSKFSQTESKSVTHKQITYIAIVTAIYIAILLLQI